MIMSSGHGGGHGHGHGAKGGMPDVVKQYYDKLDAVRLIKTTADRAYETAHTKGLEAINNDVEKLDDEAGQTKYINATVDHLLEAALKERGDTLEAYKERIKGKSKAEQGILEDHVLQEYAGITRDLMKQSVKEVGRHYHAQHQDNKKVFIKHLSERLNRLPGSHIEDSHVADIVNYIGAGDVIDTNKIRGFETLQHLERYDKGRGHKPVYDEIKSHTYAKKPGDHGHGSHAHH